MTEIILKNIYVFVLETLGLQESDPAEYFYLNRTGGVYDVPDVDDAEEFYATMVNSYTTIWMIVLNGYGCIKPVE